ncbi:MAG: 2-amino-4-hydroxy-6-hydroxymethyldihydropteridine diphosphokinase, partial [Actinomycetota bacterium]|nr:2-amino-4-hydroxy-6-hydroxymethyldihydropteridine diphosphokinase [Actinomycetota bacterium]
RSIAKKIVEMSPLVGRVSVKIEKTSPPIKENIESVGVEYVADRENLKECYEIDKEAGSREKEHEVGGTEVDKFETSERKAGKLKTSTLEAGRVEVGEVDVYMSLGSNIGDRENNLRRAVELISKNPDIRILSISSIYETEPMYLKSQDYFYNIVLKAKVKIKLSPFELLGFLKGIEFAFGRKNSTRYGPRIIDIDILYYGEMFIDSEFLKVPHPGITERKFILVPLSEIEPDFIINGMNIRKFIEKSSLTEKVNKVKSW